MVESAVSLLKTKLQVPPLRRSLVVRPSLLSRLDECFSYSLTLVCAPAGYGKSTLLTAWIAGTGMQGSGSQNAAAEGRRYAWLSLDQEDSDSVRFLRYLAASLEGIQPGIQALMRPLLNTYPLPSLQTVLALVINSLNELSSPAVLMLDDYQFVSNPAIHEGITFFLDHLPRNLHLLISSRSDPPMPLAHLRARNQLLEIRAADLRFAGGETDEFLNQVMGLSLSSEDTIALERRTEGWIAGLQMAAVAVKGALAHEDGDPSQFIASFSGSHRYILDYFVEEVLNHQPEEIVRFLLDTAILDRLTAPLCSAVSEVALETARGALEYLENANLFLINLDGERRWFRYHHLFASLLRARLNQALPEAVPQLHVRASGWYERGGWVEDAISHATQAEDWGRTARLVEQNLQTYLEAGQLHVILKWIGLLPVDSVYQRPKLCIRVAEALVHAGRMDSIEPLLAGAEAAIDEWDGRTRAMIADLTQAEVDEIRAMAAMLRGFLAVVSGDPKGGLALAQAALEAVPDAGNRERAWLHWVVGYAYRNLGRLQQALDSFAEATRLAEESGMTLRDIWTDLAITTHLLGSPVRAGEILEGSLSSASPRGSRSHGNLSRDEAYLSRVLLERNQLDQAVAHARKAVEYTQWWPSHNHIATANAFLAQTLLACGDLDGSDRATRLADEERCKGLVTPFVHSLVDTTLVRVWLARGEWSSLDVWVDGVTASVPVDSRACHGIDEYREMRLTALARAWLDMSRVRQDTDHVREALSLLACLEENARAAQRTNALVEMLVLKARARQMQRNTVAALRDLDTCFDLAVPGGYLRVFVDAGEPFRDLLLRYVHTPAALHKAYAQELLEAIPVASEVTAAGKPQQDLVEPLTKREFDVLRLMAAGCSNRKIAEELVLAEGTVKYYVHAILGKLGVRSRTRAAAVARERHLI